MLVDARDKLSIPWEDSSRQQHSDYIMTFDKFTTLDVETFLQFLPHITELWKDSGLRSAYERRREFQLVRSLCLFYLIFF